MKPRRLMQPGIAAPVQAFKVSYTSNQRERLQVWYNAQSPAHVLGKLLADKIYGRTIYAHGTGVPT